MICVVMGYFDEMFLVNVVVLRCCFVDDVVYFVGFVEEG